jgi:hypothetical protein
VSYYLLTGSLPSFNPATRYTDFPKAYFSKKSDIFIKEVHMNDTGFKSFITFEKSTYFKKIFVSPKSLGQVDEHGEDAFRASKIKEGRKLMIFEPIDLGILNPIIQLFIPLKKVYEIEILNNGYSNYQIYNIESIDIDSDGKQELIVHWLDYGGGSGGTYISAVLCVSDGQYKVVDFFPVPEPITKDSVREREELLADKSNFDGEDDFNDSRKSLLELKQYLSQHNVEYSSNGYVDYITNNQHDFKINGNKTRLSLSSYHTDNYYKFMQTGNTGGFRLVTAQSFGDGSCHFCPQSWAITSFSFVGKKFVPDGEFMPTKIDKKIGWSIQDVHGYTFSSVSGLISYMLLPPWLEMQDRDDAIMKSKLGSVVTNYVEKKLLKSQQ